MKYTGKDYDFEKLRFNFLADIEGVKITIYEGDEIISDKRIESKLGDKEVTGEFTTQEFDDYDPGASDLVACAAMYANQLTEMLQEYRNRIHGTSSTNTKGGEE